MACPDSASRPFWRRHRAAVDEPGTGDGGGTDEGELWDGAANRRPADPSACPRASPHARAPPPAHIEHAIAKYGCKEQRRKNRREAQNEGRVLLCERRAANRLAPEELEEHQPVVRLVLGVVIAAHDQRQTAPGWWRRWGGCAQEADSGSGAEAGSERLEKPVSALLEGLEHEQQQEPGHVPTRAEVAKHMHMCMWHEKKRNARLTADLGRGHGTENSKPTEQTRF